MWISYSTTTNQHHINSMLTEYSIRIFAFPYAAVPDMAHTFVDT